jgi:hypothetical protein
MDLPAILDTIQHATAVDLGYLSLKYKPEWHWITRHPDGSSWLMQLDADGRWEACRRTEWDEKDGSYHKTEPSYGRLPTRRGLSKVPAILQARISGWHLYKCGRIDCWKATPWRA